MLGISEKILLAMVIVNIPSCALLLYQYYQTKLSEYNLLFYFFIIGAGANLFYIIATLNPITFWIKVHWICYSTSMFAVFLFSLLLLQEKISKKYLVVGLIIYLINILQILLWQQINFRESVYLFGEKIRPFETAYHPFAAGINNIPIFSSYYPYTILLANLVWSISIFSAQISIRPRLVNRKIRVAQLIWIIGWGCLLTFHILILVIGSFHWVPNLILASGSALVFFLVIFVPEGMIISQAQIIRARKLYAIFNDSPNKSYTFKSINSYLDELRRANLLNGEE